MNANFSPGAEIRKSGSRKCTFTLEDEDWNFLWYALGAATGSALKGNEPVLADRFHQLYSKIQAQYNPKEETKPS